MDVTDALAAVMAVVEPALTVTTDLVATTPLTVLTGSMISRRAMKTTLVVIGWGIIVLFFLNDISTVWSRPVVFGRKLTGQPNLMQEFVD